MSLTRKRRERRERLIARMRIHARSGSVDPRYIIRLRRRVERLDRKLCETTNLDEFDLIEPDLSGEE